MSYCMFQNTVLELEQILDKLEDVQGLHELIDDASSNEESFAMLRFFKLIIKITDRLEELAGADLEEIAQQNF